MTKTALLSLNFDDQNYEVKVTLSSETLTTVGDIFADLTVSIRCKSNLPKNKVRSWGFAYEPTRLDFDEYTGIVRQALTDKIAALRSLIAGFDPTERHIYLADSRAGQMLCFNNFPGLEEVIIS